MPFFGELAAAAAGVVLPGVAPGVLGVAPAAAAAAAWWGAGVLVEPTLRTLEHPAVTDAAPTLAGCSKILSGVGGTRALPLVAEPAAVLSRPASCPRGVLPGVVTAGE